MKTIQLAVVLAILAVAFNCGFGHAQDDPLRVSDGELGQSIDRAIQLSTNGGFWGAVLVARKDKVLLARAYGDADFGGTPNKTSTLFEIASTSKPFTAAAILKLEEQGKLSTDDRLEKFFPDIPEDKRSITLHQLMTHTSGLSNKIGVPYYSTLTRTQYVSHILSAAKAQPPGRQFAYNNAGYALLAAIVEEVSGQSFETFCREFLFKPADMNETGFIQDAHLKGKPVASRFGVEGKTSHDWHWGWGYRGMGGVVTNVHDLLRWHQALRDGKVLGAKALEKYYEPYLANYACGWRVEKTESGGTRVSHGGSVAGFNCIYERDLTDDVVIVLLTNHNLNIRHVVSEVRAALDPRPVITASINREGYKLNKYRAAEVSKSASWQVTRDDMTTVLTLVDGDRIPVVIRVPTRFLAKFVMELDHAIQARFSDDDGGEAAVEGGLFLSRYPANLRVFEPKRKLSLRVLPQYTGIDETGKKIVDKRVVFVLADAQHGIWPVMLKMNVAAAKELQNSLVKQP